VLGAKIADLYLEQNYSQLLSGHFLIKLVALFPENFSISQDTNRKLSQAASFQFQSYKFTQKIAREKWVLY